MEQSIKQSKEGHASNRVCKYIKYKIPDKFMLVDVVVVVVVAVAVVLVVEVEEVSVVVVAVVVVGSKQYIDSPL